MGNERQGSKSGGFLQLFDWNAKSRKKLFSSKSDLPEQSKQKKRCDGNFPMTRFHQMLDEDDIPARMSFKASSDYSCSSSVTDEDFSGTKKAPGVVARLMGLDSLPKSNNTPEPYSSPLFDSQSLREAYYYRPKIFENHQYSHSGSLQEVPVKQKAIEKFQTEILPPKSAKTIPITHHKLLSPIKSSNFIPSKDAAHIMEAAARIIEPADTRTKLPMIGSSSVPLKVRDLKDKAQKPLKLSSNKDLKGQSMNKSWNGSTDGTPLRVFPESEELKSKGKSISLALLAKANVQKREGLNLNNNSSKTFVLQKETNELSQSTMKKSTIKKPSSQNSANVLRQNNQKQNCIVDRGKLTLKSSLRGGKDNSSRNSSKLASSSKVSSRKMGAEVKDEISSSSSERVTRKKRTIDGNFQSEKMRAEKNNKAVQSTDRWHQDSGGSGSDVVSFTFTAPMTKTGHCSGRSVEVGEEYKIFSEDSRSKRTMLSSDGTSVSKFSLLGHGVKGSDALSALLEQKLKELNEKLEFSQKKSGILLHDMEPDLSDRLSSTSLDGNKTENGRHTDNLGMLKEKGICGNHISQARKFPDCRLPSPISVLEHSSVAESCNSTDSNSTEGSKSIQAQEILGMYNLETSELSDSASSTSISKQQEATSALTSSKKPETLELEYVKGILGNIDLMFEEYASGRVSEIINPRLFDQMESQKMYSGNVPGIKRKVIFDCVKECLELRCRQFVGGGCKLWTKGLSVIRQKERLAEEVYKEISGWSAMGDSMVDEIVDKDMISQFGKWLDFEIEGFEIGVQIESRILNSLIDEAISGFLVL